MHHHTNLQRMLLGFLCLALLMDNVLFVIAQNDAAASTSSTTLWNGHFSDNQDAFQRELQQQQQLNQQNGKCWSTRDDRKPNRYCMFDDTPRSGAFLSLSCPTTRDDNLQYCECTIGIGDSKDAPNTDTCWKCGFCRDGSLAYDCRNVAEGTCIGRNCFDECLSSYSDPEDLYLGSNANVPASGFLLSGIIFATIGFLWLHHY